MEIIDPIKVALRLVKVHVSDRQWSDAINVLKVQKNNLDLDYLKKSGYAWDVAELLDKAIKESGY
jgi:hypothetical protein